MLLTAVCGTYISPSLKKKFKQVLRTRGPEDDNRYVWFTRNIHGNVKTETAYQQQLRKKYFSGLFYNEQTTAKVEDLSAT